MYSKQLQTERFHLLKNFNVYLQNIVSKVLGLCTTSLLQGNMLLTNIYIYFQHKSIELKHFTALTRHLHNNEEITISLH